MESQIENRDEKRRDEESMDTAEERIGHRKRTIEAFLENYEIFIRL